MTRVKLYLEVILSVKSKEIQMSEPIWKPSEERIENANLTRFMDQVNQSTGHAIDEYQDLYDWSIKFPELFWLELWRFSDVIADVEATTIVNDRHKMPGANWFPDTKLNFTRNLLRRRDEMDAIIFVNENSDRRSISYSELYSQVRALASSLRKMGVTKGDRVAAFMPNIPETVIAMLATASIGAIWSSCSPDFGVAGVMDRFGQIEPKVLFTADGHFYNGKKIDSIDRVRQIVSKLKSLEKLVVVPYVNEDVDVSDLPNAFKWGEFLDSDPVDEIEFTSLPFNHPLYIMYSSGTTGLPKSIVHGAGGTLLQHLKEHQLHTDLKPGDKIFYYTTCGWMMWNWLVSALASEATLVLYDGSPFYPDPISLWSMTEREKITVFGTSAKYISALEKSGVKTRELFELDSLKTILSTGSPLAHESFEYVYRDVKSDVCLSSISGGTDIVSCFALGNPIGPVFKGELQTRGLGMKVEVFNPNGKPVKEAKGDLVCTASFPSMPIYFWNDEDGSKYRSAYFERFPGIWTHGDFAELTANDGVIIHGRSDTVLNPGGVRIGAGEIYRQVETFDEVLESIVVGQQWEDSERIILFVKLRPDVELNEKLSDRIRKRIRSNASVHHVPKKVVQVNDIPRTISGKIVELAVKNIIHGLPVENRDALANPESLDLYKNIIEIQT